MIILDTNVVSELMKASPDRKVEEFVAAEPSAQLFITAITEAELRYGAAILPVGRRRNQLMAAVIAVIEVDFAERILPFDSLAAVAFAELAANRRKEGRPISQFDAQIAAIARSRGATIATRNEPDFEGCGIRVVNPWKS